MRSFNFKSKIIGDEKYLTYIMGEETELDEDVLDYCEENALKELVEIIYEEDDDYDYLTYDITNKISIDDFMKDEADCDKVLLIVRNIANSLISLKEQAVRLNYILLNRQFIYVEDNCDVKFICLPVESDASLAAEFKGFVRQLLANMKYNVDEDLNYVGKLLTYINGDNFNLRGLVGLSEALMEEAGVSFEEAGGIEADGVEVMNSEDVTAEASVKSFMDTMADADETLPEIGDDEDEDETVDTEDVTDDELESILPAGMSMAATEDEAVSAEEDAAETIKEETEEDVTEAIEEETEEDVTEAIEEETKEDVTEAIEEDIVETTTPSDEADVAEKKQEEEKISTIKLEMAEENKPEESEVAVDTAARTEAKTKPPVKETDEDVIKNRIKALTGEGLGRTSLRTNDSINSERDLDAFLDSKPPVIKKNSVKVNRAAIIQNVAASEAETEETQNVPNIVTEQDKADSQEENKNEELEATPEKKKMRSNSVLSKTVEVFTKPVTVGGSTPAPIKAIPYLIRVNTEERIMLGKTVFKIGKASRGVDYTVGGNGAISRQHAVITRKEDVSYIKDNKSTNHTYVNGKMVEDGEEVILTHDSMIKLGDEEFIFKIR